MRDSKLKHEELTLSFDKLRVLEVLNGRQGSPLFPESGIHEIPLEELQDKLRWDISWAPRGALEKDRSRVHPIPYIAMRRRQPGGSQTLMTYKRPDSVNGEQKLVGKRSIAAGGHPDIVRDHVHFEGATDLIDTLRKAAEGELFEEFRVLDVDDDDITDTVMRQLKYVGVMLDWDDVGLVHLAVLFLVDLDPTDTVLPRKADEVEDVQFLAPEHVANAPDGLYENWSDIYAHYLLNV